MGDTAALDALLQWLQHGPPLARVVGIECRGAGGGPVAEGLSIC
jgi:hypothetical protein